MGWGNRRRNKTPPSRRTNRWNREPTTTPPLSFTEMIEMNGGMDDSSVLGEEGLGNMDARYIAHAIMRKASELQKTNGSPGGDAYVIRANSAILSLSTAGNFGRVPPHLRASFVSEFARHLGADLVFHMTEVADINYEDLDKLRNRDFESLEGKIVVHATGKDVNFLLERHINLDGTLGEINEEDDIVAHRTTDTGAINAHWIDWIDPEWWNK